MSEEKLGARSLKRGPKELFVVGDRVLVAIREGEDRTGAGLVLPAAAMEKEQVQSGRVVAIGPGTPLPPPGQDEEEPWRQGQKATRYLPMDVEIGDEVLFFRKAAMEISFEQTKYLVVPHGAILVLVREASKVPDVMPDHL